MQGMAESMVPAVVEPRTDITAATTSPSKFGKLMQTLDIDCGKSQMLQGTSRPGSSQMKLGSGTQQSHICIALLPPGKAPDSPQIQQSKPVEHRTVYPSILRQKLMTRQKIGFG